MALLNQIYCAGSTGNIAIPACIHDPGKATGAFLIPKGKTFTPAEILVIQTTLMAAAIADLRKDRIFPIGPFVDIQDKSTEPTTQKYGYGDEVETDPGRYILNFQHRNGMCYHKMLIDFHDAHNKYDLLLVDDNWTIMGTQKRIATGELRLGGYSLTKLTVPKFKLADGTKKAEYWISFSLADAKQLNKYYAFVQCDFDPIDTVHGLMSVMLTNVTTNALPAGQIKVAMLTGCDSTNFASLYSSQLTKTEFVVKNALSGNVIPVSAAQVDGTGALLTLDTSSPNYPPVGGQMVVTLVAPSALATASIEGYEANKVLVTRLV